MSEPMPKPVIHRKADGPLLIWGNRCDFLTLGERLRLRLRLTSVEKLAEARWSRPAPPPTSGEGK